MQNCLSYKHRDTNKLRYSLVNKLLAKSFFSLQKWMLLAFFSYSSLVYGQPYDSYLDHLSLLCIDIDQSNLVVSDETGGLYAYDGKFIQLTVSNSAEYRNLHLSGDTIYVPLEDNYLSIYQLRPPRIFLQDEDPVEYISPEDRMSRIIDQNYIQILANENIHDAEDQIVSRTIDRSGRLLLGTRFAGIKIVDGELLKTYQIPELEISYILNRIEYEDGLLFISTLSHGLYIWDEQAYELHQFNTLNGLASSDVRDAGIDLWGNLWIANAEELTKVPNWDKSRLNTAPDLRMDSIRVDYQLIQGRLSDMQLDHDQNNIEFFFTGTKFGSEELTYQWRLSDQGEWSPPFTNRSVLFTNLQPGKHSFNLRCRDTEGDYSYLDPIQFIIGSSIWNTFIPYVLGGALLLTLLWWISNSRHDREISKITTERNKLKLENDLLKTEQKALQLQMNPHFIFNALNSIQGLIATNQNKEAKKYLGEFSKMMRSVLEQSREESIRIEEELKYLDHYLSIEQMCRSHKFEYSLDASVGDDVAIPTMILQPFVENAVIHGMKNIDRKGLISVNLTQEGELITAIIDDNGVGRSKEKNAQHNSIALKVVEDRLQKYFKLKKIETVVIEDKLDQDGLASGTKVTVTLPIV